MPLLGFLAGALIGASGSGDATGAFFLGVFLSFLAGFLSGIVPLLGYMESGSGRESTPEALGTSRAHQLAHLQKHQRSPLVCVPPESASPIGDGYVLRGASHRRR